MKKIFFIKICKAKYLLCAFLFVFAIFSFANCVKADSDYVTVSYSSMTGNNRNSVSYNIPSGYTSESINTILCNYYNDSSDSSYYNDLSNFLDDMNSIITYTDYIIIHDNNSGDYYDIIFYDTNDTTCAIYNDSNDNYHLVYKGTIYYKLYGSNDIGMMIFPDSHIFHNNEPCEYAYMPGNLSNPFMQNAEYFIHSENLAIYDFVEYYNVNGYNGDFSRCSFDTYEDSNVSSISNVSIGFNPTYNSDYSSCTLSANIIGGSNTYKLYYTDSIVNNISANSSGIAHNGGGVEFGDDIWFEYNSPLVINENKCLYFKIIDTLDNSFIYSDFYNVNLINLPFGDLNFNVDFEDLKNGSIIFTPSIKSSLSSYYDIVVSIDVLDGQSVSLNSYGGSSIITDNSRYVDKFLLINNSSYLLKYKSRILENFAMGDFIAAGPVAIFKYYTKFNLNFEIYNKNSGDLIDTKTYSIKLDSDGESTISESGSSGMSWDSLEDIWNNFLKGIDYMKEFFKGSYNFLQAITYFFSCLPDWLIYPFIFLIGIIFVLAIIKFVRGG